MIEQRNNTSIATDERATRAWQQPAARLLGLALLMAGAGMATGAQQSVISEQNKLIGDQCPQERVVAHVAVGRPGVVALECLAENGK